CCPAAHKAGGNRQSVDVTTCFVPLMRWIVALWTSTHLALALDATSLGIRFVGLTVSVVYRGCAIPVAWTVLPANQPGAWRREWLRLLWRHPADGAASGCCAWVGCGAWYVRSPREDCHCRSTSSQSHGRICQLECWWSLSIRIPCNI